VETRVQVPDHPAMGIRLRGYAIKIRKLFTRPELGTATGYVVHNNSVNNLRRGVFERVLFKKSLNGFQALDEPPAGVFDDRLLEFKRRIGSLLPPTTPISREAFADLFKGRKHTIYQDAVRSLATEGLRPKDANIKAFVKAEKVRVTPSKPDPAPRIIQPRDPRYNVEVGRYLKPIEHRLYEAINKLFGEVTVAKGLNATARGEVLEQKWLKYRDPVGVGLDATRFDQHVSKSALEWEHSIYLNCFSHGDKAELKELLGWQGTKRANSCVGRASDGSVHYKVFGKRMSGDMNTALGNVVLMCAMVWCYLRHVGVNASLLNDGDDCVLIFERRDLAKLSTLGEWFMGLGFDMKVEPPVYDLERLEFCQSKPIWVDGGYRMVRCLNALAKDNISLIPWENERDMRGWMNAVGECGLSLTGSVPIYQNFYQLYVRHGEKTGVNLHPVMYSGMRMMAKGMDTKVAEPSARTRYSFWLAFDVTPDEQIAREAIYDNISLPWGSISRAAFIGELSHFHYG